MRHIYSCAHRRLATSLVLVSWLSATSAPYAFDQEDLDSLLNTKVCNGCDLQAADLRGKALQGAQLRWSDLNDADLGGAQ